MRRKDAREFGWTEQNWDSAHGNTSHRQCVRRPCVPGVAITQRLGVGVAALLWPLRGSGGGGADGSRNHTQPRAARGPRPPPCSTEEGYCGGRVGVGGHTRQGYAHERAQRRGGRVPLRSATRALIGGWACPRRRGGGGGRKDDGTVWPLPVPPPRGWGRGREGARGGGGAAGYETEPGVDGSGHAWAMRAACPEGDAAIARGGGPAAELGYPRPGGGRGLGYER